jgi:hypothetical protein
MAAIAPCRRHRHSMPPAPALDAAGTRCRRWRAAVKALMVPAPGRIVTKLTPVRLNRTFGSDFRTHGQGCSQNSNGSPWERTVSQDQPNLRAYCVHWEGLAAGCCPGQQLSNQRPCRRLQPTRDDTSLGTIIASIKNFNTWHNSEFIQRVYPGFKSKNRD